MAENRRQADLLNIWEVLSLVKRHSNLRVRDPKKKGPVGTDSERLPLVLDAFYKFSVTLRTVSLKVLPRNFLELHRKS